MSTGAVSVQLTSTGPSSGSAIGGEHNVNLIVNNSGSASPGPVHNENPQRRPQEISVARNTTPNGPDHSESASDVYARLLLPKRIGYPLWRPGPSYRPNEYVEEGVRIGDLGFITSDGQFQFIFNVCLPATHPINIDAPPSLIPFTFHERNVRQIRQIFDDNEIISTDSVQGEPAGLESGLASLSFTCSPKEGALLLLPDGASRIDLLFRKHLFEYAQKHGLSWCRYVYDTIGLEADAGPLYLVTGADKCRNWCLGSYTNTSREMTLRFVPRNTPCRMQLYSRVSSGSARASTFRPQDMQTVHANQSVFIRGYRITLSPTFIARIFGVPVKIVDMTRPHNDVSRTARTILRQPLARSLIRSPGDQRLQSLESVVVESFPAGTEPYHPLNAISSYLLSTNPEAQFAITHDDVWCSVLNPNESHLPHNLELLARATRQFDIVQHNECVILVPKTLKFEGDSRMLLHSAVNAGNHYLIRLLLDHDRDLNVLDVHGFSPLLLGVRIGNEETVRTLLSAGANVNTHDTYGAPLLYATKKGSVAIVRLLVRGGADINAQDNFGQSALYQAAVQGDEAMVRSLLELGADINTQDKYNTTPLICAARNGYPTIVRLLVESGANVNARDDEHESALHWAAKTGDESAVRYLLESGADVNTRDRYNTTPLIRAARNGRATIVRLLVESGADINARNNSHESVLHWAANKGDESVVRYLLESGADVNTRDTYSTTPLICAARNGHAAIIKLLVEGGADVNAQDIFRRSTLLQAADRGDEAMVRYLLESGANVNARDDEHESALHWAAKTGGESVVRYLPESGADVNTRDRCNTTPLIRAARNGHATVVRLLVESGANVNDRDDEHESALYRAAKTGDESVVRYLLESGADVNTRDRYNTTPLICAALNGHATIVKLLVEHGANVNTEDHSAMSGRVRSGMKKSKRR